MTRVLGAKPLASMLTDVLLGPGTRTSDPAAAAIVATAFCRANRRGMLTAIRSFSLNRPDLTSLLETIAVPTLMTTGNTDPMWTVTQAAAAIKHVPLGALVILPAAGNIGPCSRRQTHRSTWHSRSGTSLPRR